MESSNAGPQPLVVPIGVRLQRRFAQRTTGLPGKREWRERSAGIQQLVGAAAQPERCGFQVPAVKVSAVQIRSPAVNILHGIAQPSRRHPAASIEPAGCRAFKPPMALTFRPAAIASIAALLLSSGLAARAQSDSDTALILLLDQRSCRRCSLQDVDLVHADLRNTTLQGAQLQRANLSNARLDGADLSGADLSFTSLAGASLRGADLRGARLIGTDLTHADLNGALLSSGALSHSHWQQADGIPDGLQSYAELHNAGATAAQSGRHLEAEKFFSQAIRKQPDAAISWVARGISRSEQGKTELAAQDLEHAGSLYSQIGALDQADQLREASRRLVTPDKKPKRGNNAGSALLSGAAAAIQFLGPIALTAFMPVPF